MEGELNLNSVDLDLDSVDLDLDNVDLGPWIKTLEKLRKGKIKRKSYHYPARHSIHLETGEKGINRDPVGSNNETLGIYSPFRILMKAYSSL
jgi:hypothetical protein